MGQWFVHMTSNLSVVNSNPINGSGFFLAIHFTCIA